MLIKLVPISKAEGVTVFSVPNTNVLIALTEEELAAFPNYDVILEQYTSMLKDLTRTPRTLQVPTQARPQDRTGQRTDPPPTQAPAPTHPNPIAN